MSTPALDKAYRAAIEAALAEEALKARRKTQLHRAAERALARFKPSPSHGNQTQD